MIPGLNHNIRYKDRVFHVQTEDSGHPRFLLTTHVFIDGSVVAHKRSPYENAIDPKANADARQKQITKLMQSQHRALMKALTRGEYDAVLVTLGVLKADDRANQQPTPRTRISAEAKASPSSVPVKPPEQRVSAPAVRAGRSPPPPPIPPPPPARGKSDAHRLAGLQGNLQSVRSLPEPETVDIERKRPQPQGVSTAISAAQHAYSRTLVDTPASTGPEILSSVRRSSAPPVEDTVVSKRNPIFASHTIVDREPSHGVRAIREDDDRSTLVDFVVPPIPAAAGSREDEPAHSHERPAPPAFNPAATIEDAPLEAFARMPDPRALSRTLDESNQPKRFFDSTGDENNQTMPLSPIGAAPTGRPERKPTAQPPLPSLIGFEWAEAVPKEAPTPEVRTRAPSDARGRSIPPPRSVPPPRQLSSPGHSSPVDVSIEETVRRYASLPANPSDTPSDEPSVSSFPPEDDTKRPARIEDRTLDDIIMGYLTPKKR